MGIVLIGDLNPYDRGEDHLVSIPDDWDLKKMYVDFLKGERRNALTPHDFVEHLSQQGATILEYEEFDLDSQ